MLLAVHISDGILTPPWLAGGFAGAALLALIGGWRLRDDEIPQVALLTAAFFVVSLVHLPVAHVTSVHLLLNGLMGIVLGPRVGVAIPLALLLQAVLVQHGGITALGVNSCVMGVPALFAWQLFRLLERVPWVRQRWFRALLVASSTFVWILSLVYSAAMLWSNGLKHVSQLDLSWPNQVTLQPVTLAAAIALSLLAAWMERRLENAPEFPIGLLIGESTVLLTALLNGLVLVWGAEEDWPSLILLLIVPHLVLAVIEGVVLGFTVGFLMQVKPELLHWPPPAPIGYADDGG